ncbi:MAG: hypothetical protein Q7Q71_03745 [Verrucomicrobiota bacterium JB023]|nr:hypothetical protein [Verrucomicrobiota bacterium JB023]
MMRGLRELLDEARRGYQKESRATPEMPADFPARVARARRRQVEGEVPVEAVWSRTCLIGACSALVVAASWHHHSSRQATEEVVDAWVAIEPSGRGQ